MDISCFGWYDGSRPSRAAAGTVDADMTIDKTQPGKLGDSMAVTAVRKPLCWCLKSQRPWNKQKGLVKSLTCSLLRTCMAYRVPNAHKMKITTHSNQTPRYLVINNQGVEVTCKTILLQNITVCLDMDYP
ncbi:hypothetical protein ABBQ32_003299 [Trebouxia sp. C0010 RCD-2024]